jgi:DNA-binding MarR family transcriptional regulator
MSGPPSKLPDVAAPGAGDPRRLPLSALLSQALVAFSIELDNEFEHRMRHFTSGHRQAPGARQGVWLTSNVMYLNCLRFLPDEGFTRAELERLARTATNLDGMRRWRYLTIHSRPRGAGAPPRPGRPRARADSVLRPTEDGRQARDVWQPLFGEVQQRWRERFGEPLVERLAGSLTGIVAGIDRPMPDCLPILGHGLRCLHRGGEGSAAAGDAKPAGPGDDVSRLSLHALLSRSLLAYAIAFERRSRLSLAISADVLRVVGETGVPVRELPERGGVSKEAVAMATRFLEARGHVVLEPAPPPARGKVVRLTAEGEAARGAYPELAAAVEKRWEERFGADTVTAARGALEELAGNGTPDGSPLFAGLTPYPGCWRASVRPPGLLPHFPMVLHRGGFPDGA